MRRSCIRLGRLSYSKRRADPEVYGRLIDENDKSVEILELVPGHGGDEHQVRQQQQPERQKTPRLNPLTLSGKSTGSTLVQVPSVLSDVISHHTWNVSPKKMRDNAAKYYMNLHENNEEGGHKVTESILDVETHLTGIFLKNYASLNNVLKELCRRRPEWTPKSVLDIGYGPATGILALNEIYKVSELEDPGLRVATVIGHDSMLKRARAMLKAQGDDKTMVLDQLPGNENTRNQFDLVIATHQLVADMDRHVRQMTDLLNPGGMLVLVERGDPFGFERIARARQVLLRPENHKDDGSLAAERKFHGDSLQVVAPCVHHGKCPLQVGGDLRASSTNPGHFNWCHFAQTVQRPKFAQELKKGSALGQQWVEPGRGKGGKTLAGSGRPFGKSFETATHSFLIIEKNPKKASDIQDRARILRAPMKRDKHVIMEVCAPSTQVEHWTVTSSFSKEAYHDARKAEGGDLWALGAKTIQERGGNKSKLERVREKVNKSSARKGAMSKKKIGRVQSDLEEKAWNRRVRSEKRSLDGETGVLEALQSAEGDFK